MVAARAAPARVVSRPPGWTAPAGHGSLSVIFCAEQLMPPAVVVQQEMEVQKVVA
jgi:hypothetical protein